MKPINVPSNVRVDGTRPHPVGADSAVSELGAGRRVHEDLPTVSVVIPAHNAQAYLAETIESVFAQTFPPQEVIVVNDGSTDGTADVVATFADRIRVVTLPGRGAAAARNAGAQVASGAWLAFVDADDTWLPEKLDRQIARVLESGVDIVYSDRFNIGDRGDLPSIQSDVQRMYEGDVFLDLLLTGNHITLSSAMLRTDLFRSMGGFSETLKNAEDWDLWIRIADGHRVAACPEPLVRYRFHKGMKSGNPLRMQAARNDIVGRALASARGRQLPPAIRRRIRGETARTNGADAARRGAWRLACVEYGRSLMAWPFQAVLYRDIARLLLGRARG